MIDTVDRDSYSGGSIIHEEVRVILYEKENTKIIIEFLEAFF